MHLMLRGTERWRQGENEKGGSIFMLVYPFLCIPMSYVHKKQSRINGQTAIMAVIREIRKCD